LFQVSVFGGNTEQNEGQPEFYKHWDDIKNKVKVDPKLNLQKFKDLWQMFEQFVNVFVWNKLELGCCSMGEYYIDA
jgi:hypothetical protein